MTIFKSKKVIASNSKKSLKEKYERLERELREKNRELESSKSRYKEKKYAGRRVEEEVKQSKQETENIKKTFAKELKEKDLLIKNKEEERAQWELDARTHFEALTETSKEWNEKKLKWWVEVFYKKLLDLNTVRNWTIEYNEKSHDAKTKDLEEKISMSKKNYKDQSELLEKFRQEIEKERLKNKRLEKELEEEREISGEIRKNFEKQKVSIEELKERLNLYSATNPSPVKKRKKEEVEFQQIAKKKKVENQAMVAQIEVKKQ